jgi:hypothetical protein
MGFFWAIEAQELKTYSFLPTAIGYQYAIEIVSNSKVVYSNSEDILSVTTAASTNFIDLSGLNLSKLDTIRVTLLKGSEVIFREEKAYGAIVLGLPLVLADLTIPTPGIIQVNFESQKKRQVRLMDFQGKVLAQVLSSERAVQLDYFQHGLYIVQVQEGQNYWTKKIKIE